ncbi:MAG: hypothetical protein ABSB89_00105 [Candidatus Bathyarchaeia archaeon]
MTEKKPLLLRIHDAFFWEDGKFWHNKEDREKHLPMLKKEGKADN